MSDGHISLVVSYVKVLVKILRDTRAFHSIIMSTVQTFSQCSNTGDYILMQGIGFIVLPVPVCNSQHQLRVQGEETIGVRPALPIHSVDVLLGNHL